MFTKTDIQGASDSAHFATIQSLVEKKTFIIDDSNFATYDQAFIDGHFYAGKFPILPFLSSGLYYGLNRLFGLSFLDYDNYFILYYLITLIVVGGSFVSLLLVYYKTCTLFKFKEKEKLLCVFSLGFGTLLLPYSFYFNNHVVASFLLFTGFYFILKAKIVKNNIKKNLFVSGFLFALGATIDIPPGLIFLGLFLIYILSEKELNSKVMYFIIGSIIPILLYLSINIPITGDIKPINLHPEYYKYDGTTYPADQLSGFTKHNNFTSALNYYFNSLIAKRGLFSYTPIFILSFFLFFKGIKNKIYLWKEYMFILIGCFIIIVSYLNNTSSYGGWAFGFRFFVTIIPFLFFPLIFIINRKESKRVKTLFHIFLIISIIISLIGIYDPSTKSNPLVEYDKSNSIMYIFQELTHDSINIIFRNYLGILVLIFNG